MVKLYSFVLVPLPLVMPCIVLFYVCIICVCVCSQAIPSDFIIASAYTQAIHIYTSFDPIKVVGNSSIHFILRLEQTMLMECCPAGWADSEFKWKNIIGFHWILFYDSIHERHCQPFVKRIMLPSPALVNILLSIAWFRVDCFEMIAINTIECA